MLIGKRSLPPAHPWTVFCPAPPLRPSWLSWHRAHLKPPFGFTRSPPGPDLACSWRKSIPVPLAEQAWITPKGSRRKAVMIIFTSENSLYHHSHYELGSIHQFYACIFKTGTDSQGSGYTYKEIFVFALL